MKIESKELPPFQTLLGGRAAPGRRPGERRVACGTSPHTQGAGELRARRDSALMRWLELMDFLSSVQKVDRIWRFSQFGIVHWLAAVR